MLLKIPKETLLHVFGKDYGTKSTTIYTIKEQGEWKIAYLYLQPPFFIIY